jgi:hypothetical protein
VSNWVRLQTNTFDGTGSFDLTNSLGTNSSKGFFRLEVP